VSLQQALDDFERREWETADVDGTVRLAVVGLGAFAREQALPGIAGSEYTEATTFVTSSPGDAEDVADEYGVGRVLSYDEYEAGEGSDGYDAVYVATPTGTHLDYVETAAELGKSVIVEKPIEKSVERAERVRELCEEAGVTLQVAYRPRTEPAFLRARELVDDGAIGEVTHVDATFSFRVLDLGGPDQWRIDRELAGGGALMDAGVYTASMGRFFVDAAVESVIGTTVDGGSAFDEGIDARTTFDARFADGTTASCTTSFADYYDDRVVVRGTEGRLTIEPAFWYGVAREMTLARDEGAVELTTPGLDEVAEEFAHFGYCVLADEAPLPDGDVGVRDVEILQAVYESAETDERVEP
jgi:xylose dehydrogenase (NAD/NADP)